MTTIIETPDGPIAVPVAPPNARDIPPFPHIANPLPRLVSGAEVVWGDVASAVSKGWHDALGFLDRAASATIEDVQGIVDTAINEAQTAWSTFVSINELWIAAVAVQSVELGLHARSALIDATHYLEGIIDGVRDDILQRLLDEVQGIDQTILDVETFTGAALQAVQHDLRVWAIDNIYNPLLGDLARVEHDVLVGIDGVVSGIDATINDAVHSEALRRAAAVGAIAATVAGVLDWIDNCGEPTCDVVGPRSDWGKWLNKFGPLALWAMLAAVASEDPDAIARLAEQLAATLGPVLESWTTGWLGGTVAPGTQPSEVSQAIGGNPLGL